MHVCWQPLAAKMIVLKPAPVSRVFMPCLRRPFNSRHVVSSIRQSEIRRPWYSWSFGGSASIVFKLKFAIISLCSNWFHRWHFLPVYLSIRLVQKRAQRKALPRGQTSSPLLYKSSSFSRELHMAYDRL